MRSIGSFMIGILFTLVVLVVAGFVLVKTGILPANADGKPSPLEEWAANTALQAAIERDTKGLSNPLQPSDDNLTGS
jgi:hypothetical protein